MSKQGSPPPPLEEAEIQYFDNYLYLAAGQATTSVNMYPNGFFRYSLKNNTWEDISNPLNSYISRTYAQSAIVDGYFYLIFGWSYLTNQYISDIMRVDLTSPDFAWEKYEADYSYNRNSFSLATKNTEVYLFGGFLAALDLTVNDLIQLDLASSIFTSLTSNGIFPSSRSSPSLHLVNSQIYLFAGRGMTDYLNDMWVYSIDSDVWQTVNEFGAVPLPRYQHAAHCQGNAIVIWGGEGDSGLLGDLNIYNTLTNSWTLLQTISANSPMAGKGACMCMDMPYIYIFGGLSTVGLLGQLWVYNLGSNEYTLLSSEGPQLAYITCQIHDTYFYVLFGQDSSQAASGSIIRYNLLTNVWTRIYTPPDTSTSSAQGIQLMLNDMVVRIGGQAWSLDPKNQVYIYTAGGPVLVGSIAEFIYLSGFVYYNTSFYSYGGSTVLGRSLRSSVPSQLFIRINLWDICGAGNCTAPCSPGTININSVCRKSPAGHFSEGFGNTRATACPAGTMNAYSAASSGRQCYPCPYGHYTAQAGSSSCLDCPAGFFCEDGSKEASNSLEYIGGSTVQPNLYYSPDTSASKYNFEIITVIAMGFIILVTIIWKKARKQVAFIDLYQTMHNHELRMNMVLQKSFLGGLFSLIFIMAAILVVGLAIITYENDNVLEKKSLVPLVILQSMVTDFTSSSMTISSSFLNYGDSCILNSACSSLIFVTVENIRYKSLSYSCLLSAQRTCTIEVQCTDCIIDTGAFISITLQEKLSYSTGILVNVTSSSSIPSNCSSMVQSIYPRTGFIFIGAVASQAYFAMIPSLFTSQSSAWTGLDTGYHISAEKAFVAGTEYLTVDLPIASMLNLNVFLDISTFGLYTTRVLKQDVLFLVSSLIGSLFGVIGAVGQSMRIVEKVYLKSEITENKKKYVLRLKEKRKGFKELMVNVDNFSRNGMNGIVAFQETPGTIRFDSYKIPQKTAVVSPSF